MFTDLDKLSTNELTRDLQLRVIMSMSIIYEYVLTVPNFIDLIKLEKSLLNSFSTILKEIYKHPNL